jgi:hypothetical protein
VYQFEREARLRRVFVALFLIFLTKPTLADEDKTRRALSADHILDACKEKPSEPRFRQGICLGQIQMLYLLGFSDRLGSQAKYCPPDDVTIIQARKVIIKYIDDRPEQLHKPFVFLAIEALRQAWPCGTP